MVETVDFLSYMVETVGKKKKPGKTWRNEMDTNFFALFFKGNNISKINFL